MLKGHIGSAGGVGIGGVDMRWKSSRNSASALIPSPKRVPPLEALPGGAWVVHCTNRKNAPFLFFHQNQDTTLYWPALSPKRPELETVGWDGLAGAAWTSTTCKRSQGGSDFDLDQLVALCRWCHDQPDAPYERGRLVVTTLGAGQFCFDVVKLATRKSAATE